MALAKWYANDNLKKWRIDNNLTQEEVAKRYEIVTGDSISQSLFNMWETKKKPITTEHVLGLRALTGMDHKEFAYNANAE